MDKFSFKMVRLVNHGGHVRRFDDLHTMWNARAALGFDDESLFGRATARAMEMIDNRRAGSTDTWVRRTQHGGERGAAAVRREIGVGPDEPLILIFTNVPFDAGYDVLLSLFPSMRAWLVDSVRHLLKHSSKRIVLRSHPDEGRWAGSETTADILRDENIDISRLVFISGESPINSYDLIEAADCGVVFSSTIGLEMAMLGMPVLVGSSVYYVGKGFTVDPRNASDYFALLTRISNDCAEFVPMERQVQDARLFHFLLHFAAQWPYPYDKPSAIEWTPPDVLVSGNDIAPFIPILDSLVLTEDEWRNTLPDVLDVRGDNHVSRALR